MENNNKYNEFRKKYIEFNYESYTYVFEKNKLEISFLFSCYDGVRFNPNFIIPIKEELYLNKNKDFLEKIIFNLGMVELISYWKATCSPIVNVKCGALTERQKKWWKKLYFNGLGEFFYINNITTNQNDFMQINSEKPIEKEKYIFKKKLDGCIIPIGGGKDSAVTLEILNNKFNNLCYIVNPRGATIDTVKIANCFDKTVFAQRTIDKNLIELNEKGFLNGHTPFSAMIAFSSYLVAYLYDKKYIVLSNESSANESNVQGTDINHQYSKSIEFENDFRKYIRENLSDEILYFSLLRPLNEFKIVELFCKNNKYFNIFKSCNVGSKENKWCNNCPKCLYVYIMLLAFLPENKVIQIFGGNMLNNINLKSILDGLVNEKIDKPFECVGTKEEINYALYIIINKFKNKSIKIPILLKYYIEKYSFLYNNVKNNNISEKVEKYYNNENNLPFEFKELI